MWAEACIKYYRSYLDRLRMTLKCCFTADSFAETFVLFLHIKPDFHQASIFSWKLLCAILLASQENPELSRLIWGLGPFFSMLLLVFLVCVLIWAGGTYWYLLRKPSPFTVESVRPAGPLELDQKTRDKVLKQGDSPDVFTCLNASLTSEWPESDLSLFC